MKFFKISLYILVGFALLLVIGASVFIATFDANDYKPLISEQVKQQTGREFTLDDIKPSVFPWLGIELQQISLSNAKGFKADNMLTIERLDVRVELLPLLKQEIHIDTLRLHGLELHLEQDKKAKTNWDDILEKQAALAGNKAEKSVSPEKTKEVVSTDPLAALLINGVEIKDASINWSDAISGQAIKVQKFNLNTGAIRQGKPLPVNLSALINLSEPEARVITELKTSIEFDLATQQLKLTNLNVLVDTALEQDALKKLRLSLDAQLDADLKKQHFVVPAYVLEINAQGKAIPGEKITSSLKGDADINLKNQTAKIEKLVFETMGLSMQAKLAATDVLSSPNIKGQVNLDDFNPQELAKKMAIELPETKNKNALKKASLNFDVIASNENVQIKNLKLKLDKTMLLAGIEVENFEKPEINYTINIDQINLDDYLPPATEPTTPAKQSSLPVAANANADIPITLPTPLLRSLNVNGVLNIDSINAFEQSISNLKMEMLAKDGLIRMPVLNAQLLKGNITSSVQLDVRKNTPRYQFKFKGKNLNGDSIINPILQDLSGEKNVSMSGVMNMALNLKTSGQSVNQLIAGSNGQFNMKMGAAKLHGVDVEYFVRKGVVGYLEEKKQTLPESWRGEYKPKETTALKVASASGVIRKGVVENKDLLLDSSRFKITGAGKINLPTEKLDYRLVIDINQATTKTAAERLLDIPMPVFIRGGFSQPGISVDSKVWLRSVGKTLKAEAKKEVKKKVKQEKKKQKKKIKKKLKDKLKKLF